MEFNATFIASAISFIVFVFIMNAIFYKPLQKVVDERQNFIDEATEVAKVSIEKKEAILKDKAKKLEKTKHEAKKIIVNKSNEVKAQKTVLTSEAQQKAGAVVDTAKGELLKASQDAQVVLSEDAKKLAQAISSKILGDLT